MNPEPSGAEFYVTGGTMSPTAHSYVIRAADDELFRAVAKGEYCYVLTSRQMGKSSLMARTAQQLAGMGVRSAQITLETIRESGTTPKADEFLYSIANRIHKELGLPERLADWWRERELLSPTQRLYEYLADFLLDRVVNPIVVFIDEIDSTIGLPFADDFYATIRACYNARASNTRLGRLTFVLLGVATPAQLITDPTRTPFNIGHGIELGDFTMDQAERLTGGLPGSTTEKCTALARILEWTGGHPYLTQTLCRALADPNRADLHSQSLEDAVDQEVERLFLRPEAAREEANLKFVHSRLTRGTSNLRPALRIYRRVLNGQSVADDPASSIYAALKLAGVVRTDLTNHLRVRNQIYARVFDLDWVRREMPRSRARAAVMVSVVAILASTAFALYSSYRITQQARTHVEDLFYAMKALDVDIANAEIMLSASGDPVAQERLRTGVARRQESERRYDLSRLEAGLDQGRLSEKDRLILRVTRILGEYDGKVPSGYLTEVNRYIQKWQTSDRYRNGIARATLQGYTKSIVAELKAQNLPPQFFYLALEESNFDAFSSGAETRFGIPKGMWQLIPDTARRYGLQIGPLSATPVADPLDDRHKWRLATSAATRYIKDIYATDAQGSGILVIASYNWGDGRISRLLRTMPSTPRERNFWVLLSRYPERIPAEVYEIVYSVVSAAVIGENPRLFGFSFDNPIAD